MNKCLIFIKPVIVLVYIVLIFCFLFFSKIKIFNDDKTINIFTFTGVFEKSVILDFEKKTKIKVNINYYSTNEELLSKLKRTRAVGYDLIIPSDYAVEKLIKHNLLKKINKEKLNFLNDLNHVVLNHYYDKKNEYSIPLQWEVYGIGIDSDFFKKDDFSWSYIFDGNSINYRISMTDDPIEAVNLASFYLYGELETLKNYQKEEVQKLLIKQKSWVEAYQSTRADYLILTKNCQASVVSTSYIFRDSFMSPYVKFKLPSEGTFITIENVAIPKTSKKEDLVYKFLDHIYKPENFVKTCDVHGQFPATINSIELFKNSSYKNMLQYITKENKKFLFFKHLIPEKEIRNIWVNVKE